MANLPLQKWYGVYSLVNVDNVKTAVLKLKEINWLYGDSIDDASKKVIEIVNSTMLDKADDNDIPYPFNLIKAPL